MATDTSTPTLGHDWWRALTLPPLGVLATLDGDASLFALVRRALDGGPPATELTVREGLSHAVLVELRSALTELGLRCVHRRERMDGTCPVETFASEAGLVQLATGGDDAIVLHAVLQGDETVRRAREALRTLVAPTPKGRGRVYLLTTRHGAPAFTRVGCAGAELIRRNYSPDTLDSLDHAVKDVQSASPCGRLVLVEGPPGTGKSYLLRGMMYGLEDAEFLVIPPHMLPSMVGPSLVNALFEVAEDLPDGRRVVLVLEDADECLVPRQADNVAAISTLLDLTDGLLSAVTDFRVLVSTNAKHVEIDPAIVRAGRLCRHIHVAPLNPDHANRTLRDLLRQPDVHAFHGPVPLAEVYHSARKLGWQQEGAGSEEAAS